MKLLYWYTRFKAWNGEPIEYHGLRGFELNLSTDTKYQYDSAGNILCRDVCSTPLPDNFWGGSPLYNLNAIVGNNGAGKTTVIYVIIDTLQELFDRKVRSYNETIFVIEDNGKQSVVHLRGGEKDKTEKIQIPSNMQLISIPLGYVEGHDRLIEAIQQTKIIYFTNTLSHSDDDRCVGSIDQKQHARYSFVYDASLCGTIRHNAVDDCYKDENKDLLSVYFVNEVYKQVKFVCDRDQRHIIDMLKEKKGLPVPQPSKLTIIMREINDAYYNDGFRRNLHSVETVEEKIAYVMCVACYASYARNVNSHIKLKKLPEELPKEANAKSFCAFFRAFIGPNVSLGYREWLREYEEHCKSFISYVCKTKDKLEKIISDCSPTVDIGYYGSTMFSVDITKESMGWLVEFVSRYRRICSPHYFLDFNWGLSSGENNLLRLFSSTFYAFYHSNYPLITIIAGKGNVKCDTVLFLMDEADLTYHPEWQRQLVEILSAFLGLEFGNSGVEDLQVLLTTHSPLLLGDIPTCNVSYLGGNDCDTRGDFYPDTFGQNIHSLLKDSFFLSSGIGSFATKKINEVASILRDAKDKDIKLDLRELRAYKQVIDLVAPGIIKDKLMELYSSVTDNYDQLNDIRMMKMVQGLRKEQLETLDILLKREMERRQQ